MAKKPMPAPVLLLIGGICMVAAVVLWWILAQGYQDQARAAATFVATTGTITHAELVDARTSKRRNHWRARFAYRYEVAGQAYDGDRSSFLGASSAGRREQVEELLDAHPPGSPVEVYYDPQDPAQAVLDKSEPDAWALVLPLLPAAFGVFLLGFGWRRLRAS